MGWTRIFAYLGAKPRKGGQDLKFFSLRSGEGECTIFGARNIKVMQASRAKAEVIAKLEEEGKLVFVQHGPGRKIFVVDRAVRTSASDILGIVAKGSRGKIVGDNVMISE